MYQNTFVQQQLLNEMFTLSEVEHESALKVDYLLHDNKYYIIVTEFAEEGDLYSYFKK